MHPLQSLLIEQITILRSNGRFAIAWALSLLGLGIVATIVLYWLPAARGLVDVAKIGPSVVMAAISSFQFKTFAVYRERSAYFAGLNLKLTAVDELAPEMRAKVEQLAIDSLKEFAKGI